MTPSAPSSRRPFLLVLAVALLATGSALAQDRASWSIGAGAVVSPRPYEGVSTEIIPIPVLTWHYKGFFFEGMRAGFGGPLLDHLSAEVFVQARFDGYEADDSAALTGMEDRDPSADLGLEAKGTWEHFEVGVSAMTDVLDESDGEEVELFLAFPASAGRWRVTPQVALEWQNADLANHYYGVRESEATADRPAYEPGKSVNVVADLGVLRPFGERWLFAAGVEATWLADEIVDSPIVADDVAVGGYFAFTYRFGADPFAR